MFGWPPISGELQTMQCALPSPSKLALIDLLPRQSPLVARSQTIMLLRFAPVLLLAVVATTEASSPCFPAFLEASLCYNEIEATTPLDGFTCGAVRDLLGCFDVAAGLGCLDDYGSGNGDAFAARERQMARVVYPAARRRCRFLRRTRRERRLLSKSSSFLLCSPRDELKLNLALDGCGGFMLARRPSLLDDPCETLQQFGRQCLDKHLNR